MLFDTINLSSVLDLHSKKVAGYSFYNSYKSKTIRQSISRKGCLYDNTCIESFHAMLKKIHHILTLITRQKKYLYSNIFKVGTIEIEYIVASDTKHYKKLKTVFGMSLNL